jgi:hypothetical protein
VANFDGGQISSDAGALLLKHVNDATGMIGKFAQCFQDHRAPALIEHRLEELLGQRVFGIALGYEDLNDHDELRKDPLLATLVGKLDPTGKTRRRSQDQGIPLAGKSTLNRLELTPEGANAENRYKKITWDTDRIDALLVEHFLNSYTEPPEEIVLDADPTDDRVHGNQEGKFFHGFYGDYCYLPLYIFCQDHLLASRLRPSNIDASEGTVEELKPIVVAIRERWPQTRIILRADSGFARQEIFSWCEHKGVFYVTGLARNSRLQRTIESELEQARLGYLQTGKTARIKRNIELAAVQLVT